MGITNLLYSWSFFVILGKKWEINFQKSAPLRTNLIFNEYETHYNISNVFTLLT